MCLCVLISSELYRWPWGQCHFLTSAPGTCTVFCPSMPTIREAPPDSFLLPGCWGWPEWWGHSGLPLGLLHKQRGDSRVDSQRHARTGQSGSSDLTWFLLSTEDVTDSACLLICPYKPSASNNTHYYWFFCLFLELFHVGVRT